MMLLGPRIGPGAGCLDCLLAWQALRSPWTKPGVAATPEEFKRAIAWAHAVYQREGEQDWDNSIALGTPSADGATIVPTLRRGDCPRCGGGAPAALAARLGALANPLTGLVMEARTIPAAFGRSWSHGAALLPAPHAPEGATGSGATPAEARRRMVFEAAERHSIAWTGEEADEVEALALDGPGRRSWPAADVYLHAPEGRADSTGCAAAPTMGEAIRHGWLEAIERDALARWWMDRPKLARLEAGRHGWWREVCRELERMRRTGWLLALPSPSGVPVVVALSAAVDGRQIYLGAAADFDPAKAIQRAAAEMLQFLLWDKVTGAPPGRDRWLKRETLDTQPWLAGRTGVTGMEGGPARPPAGYRVDLTRPWLGVPVVRVIVPGLLAMPAGIPI